VRVFDVTDVVAFNSLSRDHIQPVRLKPITTLSDLSTPSLGITTGEAVVTKRSVYFQLPLSGSQEMEKYLIIALFDAREPFNSLSRDH